jgi:ABC-type multidrug transport system ATPase subunit
LSAFELKIPFGDLWSNDLFQPLLIANIINIPLYIFGLALIEFLRTFMSAKAAQRHFKRHLPSISSPEVTAEAIEVGQQAHDMTQDFAIRVRDVTRVFVDDSGTPVVAVNNVSLGVKHGTLFGFLGANGAGKTTLMKLITGEIPPSSGFVNVDGTVSICPQFNTHLTNEMTVNEHFTFFAYIFGVPPQAGARARDRFVRDLVLGEHVDKQVQTLSGGNARKLTIAIALFSNARVVLLDEPTSSLDPLARHSAQRLINSFRGTKTMMLCTHLLAEAEELCESISIMLRGTIYVVGAPAYLSAKFGTEWRLDVLFSQPTDGAFNYFLRSHIPSARLVIYRPSNEIYSIPSSAIPMVGLFRLMNVAVATPQLAVRFFTASSATLEKVFMELVMWSEAAAEAARVHEIVTP